MTDNERIGNRWPMSSDKCVSPREQADNFCRRQGAYAECEYWQSKIKERDELLAEMAGLIEMFRNRDKIETKESGRPECQCALCMRTGQLLTRYANLKAK